MSSDKKMLMAAAVVAAKQANARVFLLGAIGLRSDGVFVSSRNISAPGPAPDHHAETRLIRKLTPGSTVWVARIARGTGEWAIAKPCAGCEKKLRRAGVDRVVYTISPNEWGVLDLQG